MAGPSTCRDVPFNNISAFLQHCSTAKRAKKEEALRKFRRYSVPRTADDIFEVYRLLLPKVMTSSWLSSMHPSSCLITGTLWQPCRRHAAACEGQPCMLRMLCMMPRHHSSLRQP
jgi:hypothetical protein